MPILSRIADLFAKSSVARTISVQALRMVVAAASPKIATMFRSQIQALKTIAEETNNPYDDILVRLFLDVLDLDACQAKGKEGEKHAAKAVRVIEEHGVTLDDDLQVKTPQQNAGSQ